MKKKELHFHNLRDLSIEGPFAELDEVCQIIHQAGLAKNEFLVTETTITREEIEMDSPYSVYLHKLSKKNKKPDIETEALTEKNLVYVTGEVKQ